MKTSTNRILTTHVDSLPRPEILRSLLRARDCPRVLSSRRPQDRKDLRVRVGACLHRPSWQDHPLVRVPRHRGAGKGATLIPRPETELLVELALARGKKLYDKRAAIGEREAKRAAERAMKRPAGSGRERQ